MNIFSDKTYNNKPIINSNNANREEKLKQNASEFTFDNKKDTSLNSSGNICKITNNNIFNNSNIYEYQQMRNTTINSIDDKYKNLENPFTNPEIPRRPEEERRARIFERIRKSQYQSKSVTVSGISIILILLKIIYNLLHLMYLHYDFYYKYNIIHHNIF